MKNIIALLFLMPMLAHGQIITTIAGNGVIGDSGDGGPASATAVRISPEGLATDKNGNLFISSYNNIRKIDAAGIITTIAGVGSMGYNGDGIPATTASLRAPGNIAADTNGNVYFVDEYNYRIRRIDAVTHIITTVAGDGTFALWNYDSTTNVSSSSIGEIQAMCMDRWDNIYISNGYQVGKITPDGNITVVAGSTSLPVHFPMSFSPQPATSAVLGYITAIHVDASGNLYIKLCFPPEPSHFGYAAILKVDPAGTLRQYAGNGWYGSTGDGGMATDARISGQYTGFYSDDAGNLYFSVYEGVRKVDASGHICTVAGSGVIGFSGDGDAATSAQLQDVRGIVMDTSGNLFIADERNERVRKVTQPTCANIYATDIVTVGNCNELSIYPNPATAQLTINASYPIATIAISNLVGQTVYTQHYHSTKADVDVAALPAGVYFVRINDTEVRRFVKE